MSRRHTRGRKRKRNPGWFKKGFDARRSSYRFTAQDCRLGYWVAAILHPELREWLRMHIRCYYHERSKRDGHATQEEDRCRAPGRDGEPAGSGAGDDDVPW